MKRREFFGLALCGLPASAKVPTLQEMVAAAKPNGIVWVEPHHVYRLSGVLHVPAGVTIASRS